MDANMTELVLQIDEHIAHHLSKIAKEEYDGDQNAVVVDALLLLFLQSIPKERRELAKLIYEIRNQVQSAGGVTENEIDDLIKNYRQKKRSLF